MKGWRSSRKMFTCEVTARATRRERLAAFEGAARSHHIGGSIAIASNRVPTSALSQQPPSQALAKAATRIAPLT